MALSRRNLLFVLGAAASMLLPVATVQAQDYPTKPITWVVPYGAGSSSDLVARLIASKASEILGERLLVENRPGGSGQVGTEYVLSAAPDGYTLEFASNSTHGVAPSLFKNLSYSPSEDFTPIALLTEQPQAVVVPASLGISSIEEFVAYAKDHPGELNYASTGIGTGAHLAPATFATMAGIELTHVPYQGGGKAIPELVAGRVQLMFYPYQPLKGFIDSGDLVVLATTGRTRSPWLPDTPTMIELGYKDFAFPSWAAVVAPKGTDPAIADKLAGVFEQVLKDPGVIATLAESGIQPTFEGPAELHDFIAAEVKRYKGVLENAGVEPIE